MTSQLRQLGIAAAAGAMLVVSAASAATYEVDFGSAVFSNPTNVDNSYWPLAYTPSAVYAAETEDGCEVNQVMFNGDFKDDFGGDYAGLTGSGSAKSATASTF